MNRFDIILGKEPILPPPIQESPPVPLNKDGIVTLSTDAPFKNLEYPEIFNNNFVYERFLRKIGRTIIGGIAESDPNKIVQECLREMSQEVVEIISAPNLFVTGSTEGHVANFGSIPIVVCSKIPAGIILLMPGKESSSAGMLICMKGNEEKDYLESLYEEGMSEEERADERQSEDLNITTCDSEALERFGHMYGVIRWDGQTDDEFRERLIARIRGDNG